jgi:Domain of unknown function (DUF5134)
LLVEELNMKITFAPRWEAHASLGAAMVAMAVPAVPGWLPPAVSAPAALWFLGAAAVTRRPADIHHAVMAAAMVWMAVMPPGSAACHETAGPVAGAAAAYFWLAAAPFLTAPFRTAHVRIGRRLLGSLSHAGMSLAMATLLTFG